MTAELRLDLDVMEQNARSMAEQITSLNKHWRPHIKSHCQPRIAQTLVDLGACGVTAANVAEVEVMAEAGMPSILLAQLVAATGDLDRLAAVASRAELLVTIDHFVHAELFSAAAQRHGIGFRVLVDVDVGMRRTGCRPRVDATQLAVAAGRLPGVEVVGIMGYEGHLVAVADAEEKRRGILESMNALQQTRDEMLRQGVCCEIVSAGGTGTFSTGGQHSAVTELQAGGGIFGDPFYQQQCGLTGVVPALTIVAEVVSRPSLVQAVLNCGRKAINPVVHPPHVIGVAGATVEQLSAEHTVLSLDGDAQDLKIGDAVHLAVGYSDHTLFMHREIQVYRGERKIDVWPVIRGSTP